MNVEIRKELEKNLLLELKKITSVCFDLKVYKSKLCLLFSNEKYGEIYVQHLSKADGYYAGVELFKCEAMDFCISQSPPYSSQLMNSSFLSKSSLSEADKRFGDEIGGIIRTPTSHNIKSTAEKIQQRLIEFYLPDVEHCITSSLSLIDDILAAPDNYAYPFLAALFCAQKNGLSANSNYFQKILNHRKIFGNKRFDIALAQKILD
ncbi:hypothetical protein [Pseudomonas agarici]|uniref:hypothetical protein n=1 Tax=Pseudomonas agarici TaxID=46677 RepID=UPI0009E92E38|nr:hypothetical protein [Pseudomonas agarici]